MSTVDGYPYVSSFFDRHGRERWRWRKGGKTIALPGSPGQPEFDAAYAAAVAGLPRKPPARVVRLKSAPLPRTLGEAWKILTTRSPEWKALDPATIYEQTRAAERFLMSAAIEGKDLLFRDVEFSEINRRHVRALLARMSDRPHAAKKVLRLLRKLVAVALDEDWIEVDPTAGIKHAPDYVGWRAWTDDERRAYETRWPVGSTPRLVYALGLYTGQRRGDLCRMTWDDVADGEIHVVQGKTAKELWLPVHPALAACLAATPRRGPTILVTQYGQPFSDKSLGMRMMDWTAAAGIAKGATIHGLRKTLGKLLAESGATTRELMDVLGHDDIAHAELYSRAADQRRMARHGFDKLEGGRLAVIKGGKSDG